MAGTKTDNSFLDDKIYLRAEHLPKKEKIYLLDAFAGKGVIWKKVASVSKKKIMRLAIDLRPDEIGFHLPGNNIGWMEGIDIKQFDVIDLDAYGVPYEQLKIVFNNEYKGIVFVTFIQSIFGAIPHGLLIDIGINEEMIKKCPTLFYRSGWDYFLN